MSHSNCNFLTCIEISQEAGKVVWYSHVFNNFPQFVVIHALKGLSIVSEAEVDVFVEFSHFFYNWMDVSNLISGSSSFSKSSLSIWTFSVHVLAWSLAWRILSITFQACEMRAIVWQYERSLALPFFEIPMKSDLFQSCGHLWVFHNCWHIECSTFTASSFRIWNSSAVIPSPPVALRSDAS